MIHRMRWTVHKHDGSKTPLSLGFYLNDTLDKSKFSLDFGNIGPDTKAGGYIATLTISGLVY